jgi:eukaryotic-like serine/threonine-protein kinase
MGMPEDDDTRPQPLGVAPGGRLGRFEILGPLGSGGMGYVYRARDTQLEREVAIKVLPAAFWNDANRQRRFEREARAAASLNHPNVLAVYDFGVHDGVAFLVTELLEGQTLRHRIDGHPLPMNVALDYATQLVSGLVAGHERGIIHRDLKPDNLFVTTDGRIKILDFGLAKVIDPSAEDGVATVTYDGNLPAPVVGTAGYMSPEQVSGLRTDHRSDIFSAGVVLFELFAGFSPFRRPNPGESLHAILNEEPPPLTGVPPELERTIRHCLEKAPEQRFQDARDLAFALQSLPREHTTAPITTPAPNRSAIPWLAFVLLAAVAGAAAFALLSSRRARQTVAPPPSVARVDRVTDLPGIEEFPSISPDGRSVAFTASVAGRRQVFVRLLTGGTPVQITRDDADHQVPRWSADGNSLIYFSPARAGAAEGDIWSIPALGGSPRRVIASIGGGDVGSNGRVACFRLLDRSTQLVTSALDGSDVRVIAQSVADYHLYPRWSPDGQWIAFQRGDGVRYDVYVIRSGGGEARRLTNDRNIIRGLAWLPDSRGIVYGSSRGSTLPYLPPIALWRVDLDGGTQRQITPGDVWYEQPDAHQSGLVAASRVRMTFDIWSFPFGEDPADNVRRAEPVTRQTGQVLTPTASPDGEQIAFLSDSGGHGNVWVASTSHADLRQITFEDDPGVTVGVPIWSPDGTLIAFVSSRGRTGFDFGVWLVDPDGRNLRNLVNVGLGAAWSPDGRWLYYAETGAGVLNKIPASGGTPVRVRSDGARNVIGVHGNTLYYTVEHVLLDGRPEVEIRAATPENGPSRAIARIAASRVPSWQIVSPVLSPNGEWLAMPLTDEFTTNIWALSIRTGAWRQVTDFGDRATFIARRVSWSGDGRSILAAVGDGDADIVLFKGLSAAP